MSNLSPMPSSSTPPKKPFISIMLSPISYIFRSGFEYVFPVLLIIIESFVKTAYPSKDLSFIGPTLASIGLGFLIPLISLKHDKSPTLTQQTIDELRRHGLTVTKESAIYYSQTVLFFLTVAIGLWIWSVHLSINSPNATWLVMPAPYVPGFISYFLGVLLCEGRKKV